MLCYFCCCRIRRISVVVIFSADGVTFVVHAVVVTVIIVVISIFVVSIYAVTDNTCYYVVTICRRR